MTDQSVLVQTRNACPHWTADGLALSLRSRRPYRPNVLPAL